MRKVTLKMPQRLPSWNFCKLDDFTANGRFSKENCKFCVRANGGYRCLLFDANLTSDVDFVHKCPQCIKAAAGFGVEEAPTVQVDPKLVMKETLKQYKSVVKQLLSQGYPKEMAETLAEQFVMGGN